MSDIFDIPETEKSIKKKREMTPEAKTALLERLRAGRERAKAKRAEAKKSMKPVVEEPVIEVTDTEAEPVSDYKSSVEEEPNNNLDNDDIKLLADEIEQLEAKVNGYKKKEKKVKVGGIVSNYTKKRNDRIDSLVEKKVAERMAKYNKPTQAQAPTPTPAPKPARTPTPAPLPVRKPSKFEGKIKPLWARGFNI
jgi:hypothetical protein